MEVKWRNSLAYRPSKFGKVLPRPCLEAFRLRCQAQNLSVGTLAGTTSLQVLESLPRGPGVTMAKEVTPDLIRPTWRTCAAGNWPRATCAGPTAALRCFFGFLSRERLIPQNPFQLVEKPRMEQKLIKPLSMDQVRLLLAGINQKRLLQAHGYGP